MARRAPYERRRHRGPAARIGPRARQLNERPLAGACRWRISASARDRLVADALRLGCFFAEALALVRFVLLIVAVEEHHLRIAFEREDVGGDAIEEPAIVRDHHDRARE